MHSRNRVYSSTSYPNLSYRYNVTRYHPDCRCELICLLIFLPITDLVLKIGSSRSILRSAMFGENFRRLSHRALHIRSVSENSDWFVWLKSKRKWTFDSTFEYRVPSMLASKFCRFQNLDPLGDNFVHLVDHSQISVFLPGKQFKWSMIWLGITGTRHKENS